MYDGKTGIELRAGIVKMQWMQRLVRGMIVPMPPAARVQAEGRGVSIDGIHAISPGFQAIEVDPDVENGRR